MTRRLQYCSKLSVFRRVVVIGAAFGVLSWASPASAQLSRVGGSIGALEPGGIMRGTDTAYDPAHDVYLLVTGNGPVYGVFVNAAGAPVTGAFTVMDGGAGWAHFPRAEYSPHVPNGVGGLGGFLVTWHHSVGNLNYVFARLASFDAPARLVSGIQQISAADQGGSWWETGPAMAYSRTSRRFLVAWRTLGFGILGRFVDLNGAPSGGVISLENPGGSRDPALAWNPATDEFGLLSTGFGGSGAFAAFRRVRASDGLVSGRTSFGFAAGTFATAIDVNTATNQYLASWALHPGTMTAVFDQFGTQLNSNLVTTRLGFDQSLGIAYNPTSGTFLAVSSDINSFEIGAVEVKGNGEPNTISQIVTDGARSGSFYPMTTARTGTNQWDVVYSRDFRGATSQIVATSATGGGGGSIGGGGGGGTAPGPFPPPTVNVGCSTPDPFVSIGGGTCSNGGWVPKGSAPAPAPAPAPPPPPPPAPTGCSTADPFVSIGGGTCSNGGWVPKTGGSAPAPAPAPAPVPPASTCSTPDPFTSIGGGTCVNGGWTPGRPASSCTTPDPFASIGGGTCINGGWVPTASSCTTPDPFTSLGGGVCSNGGWRPR